MLIVETFSNGHGLVESAPRLVMVAVWAVFSPSGMVSRLTGPHRRRYHRALLRTFRGRYRRRSCATVSKRNCVASLSLATDFSYKFTYKPNTR